MYDIKTKSDIEQLVNSFYLKLLQIDELKLLFDGINFESHLPNIIHFWSFVLLDEPGYKTNVFEKHIHLPIKLHQFDMWLSVFIQTTDQLFLGETANLAKQRAAVLTQTFKSKWAKIKTNE
jgi:hemoglobin